MACACFWTRFSKDFGGQIAVEKAFENGVDNTSQFRSDSQYILVSFSIQFSASHGRTRPKLALLEGFFSRSGSLESSGGFSRSLPGGF